MKMTGGKEKRAKKRKPNIKHRITHSTYDIYILTQKTRSLRDSFFIEEGNVNEYYQQKD